MRQEQHSAVTGRDGGETSRKYLYGVVSAPEALNLPASGVAGPDHPLYAIEFRGLAAIASDCAAEGYENNRRNMTAHMRVLEALMVDRTVLPLRFNSRCEFAEAVRDKVLKGSYDSLLDQLNCVKGRIELGLKAFWRDNVLFEEIAAENSAIQDLRDRIARRPPAAMYHERIKLGEMVEKALVSKRQVEAERLLDHLRPHVEDAKMREPASERVALDAALLLKASMRAAFDKQLDALDRRETGRLSFKCVGPTPLYNFVRMTLL